MENPFIFRAYESKHLFCDREKELQRLITNTLSRADTTLIAQRRMGKTGLIHRLFDEIATKQLPILPIYVDIFATRSLEDLVKTISTTIARVIPQKSSVVKQFTKVIKSLRPIITYDPISTSPQLQLTFQSEAEQQQTLAELLKFLDSQNIPVLLAIDEFQQIRNYPETNIEALLRTIIQTLNNTTFLFCGSKRHMMLDIFSNERNPFYRSTEFIHLQKIEHDVYADFIERHFRNAGLTTDSEAIDFILNWTERHTYFTQRLCHTTFNLATNKVNIDLVKLSAHQILQTDAVVFAQYQQMLTHGQWNLLIAIAKEGTVSQVTSQQFSRKHRLGNPSSISRSLAALVNKNLIDENPIEGKNTYTLNDVFLARWLGSNY